MGLEEAEEEGWEAVGDGLFLVLGWELVLAYLGLGEGLGEGVV